ncbi:MAG: hypothetical protein ACOC3G_07590, partial [Phycisphaeraceae bacterium]
MFSRLTRHGVALFACLLAAATTSHAQPLDAASDSPSVAADIAHWATLPANGPEGRPLPLTGSWNIGRWYQQQWKGWGGGGGYT